MSNVLLGRSQVLSSNASILLKLISGKRMWQFQGIILKFVSCDIQIVNH